MAEVVLDTSAILAVIFGEPGGAAVTSVMDGAFMSPANFAEVITKLIERGADVDRALAMAIDLPVEIAPASKATGIAAGLLHAKTRGRGVSLGDRFCLALAREMNLPVYTADRAWAELGLDLDIRLIR